MQKTYKVIGLILGAIFLAISLWWRKHPSACPYGQRFWIEAPHPLITRARLCKALLPQSGEYVLEIGPGTGYYTLEVAQELLPEGKLEIFDLQQKMLDHTINAAQSAGIENITSTQGDAQRLPYPNNTFDAVFLVTVLGEIPDQDTALKEIARVLKPTGRLVVGEVFGDPHWVHPKRLRQRAEQAGLTFAGRQGSPLGYYALFNQST